MFDFLIPSSPCSTGMGNSQAAQNAFKPQKTGNDAILDTMAREIGDLQKIVDAVCKVYVAENKEEIAKRPYPEQYYQTDMPIINRAKLLELEHQIFVAEMELKELKRGAR